MTLCTHKNDAIRRLKQLLSFTYTNCRKTPCHTDLYKSILPAHVISLNENIFCESVAVNVSDLCHVVFWNDIVSKDVTVLYVPCQLQVLNTAYLCKTMSNFEISTWPPIFVGRIPWST